MPSAYHALTALSVVLFAIYGGLVLFADGMADEFSRFGLSRYRRMTGALELLGATGLAVGYFVPGLTFISAVGLAALMVLGVAVRVRARDSWLETSPALLLLAVNAFIALHAFRT